MPNLNAFQFKIAAIIFIISLRFWGMWDSDSEGYYIYKVKYNLTCYH